MGTTVSPIEIRRLSARNIEDLVGLEAANQPRPWSEAVFSDEIAAKNRAYLAVFDGKQLLAYGGVLVIEQEAHILNLLVAPDQRRQGHARRLMIALVEASIEMGARHMTLEVRSRNEAAIELYRRFGMAPVGIRPGYYGDDDAVIMWAHDLDTPQFQTKLEELR